MMCYSSHYRRRVLDSMLLIYIPNLYHISYASLVPCCDSNKSPEWPPTFTFQIPRSDRGTDIIRGAIDAPSKDHKT